MATTETQSAKDRRQFIWTGVVMGAVILAITLFFMASSSVFRPVEEQGPPVATGSAIERPYGGAEPTSPGDRGGSQQLALLLGMTTMLVGGVGWVVHSSRKARRQRARTEAPRDPDATPTRDSGSRVDELGLDHAPHDPSSPGGTKSSV